MASSCIHRPHNLTASSVSCWREGGGGEGGGEGGGGGREGGEGRGRFSYDFTNLCSTYM